jgi:hypothetical protein
LALGRSALLRVLPAVEKSAIRSAQAVADGGDEAEGTVRSESTKTIRCVQFIHTVSRAQVVEARCFPPEYPASIAWSGGKYASVGHLALALKDKKGLAALPRSARPLLTS